jgi:hypothetical protein
MHLIGLLGLLGFATTFGFGLFVKVVGSALRNPAPKIVKVLE